ncbi:MAG: hypothetical protein JXA11_16255 [Phycisphaerae bacterium]|nr:hypothetical protein [Phycisphaerae bacterium]
MAQHARKMTGLHPRTGHANTGTYLRVHSFRTEPNLPEALLTDFDVARELHDSVGQQLTAVSLLLGRLERKIGEHNTSDAKDIHRIQEHLLSVNREIQALSRRAMRSSVRAEGFTGALRELAESVRQAVGLHTILKVQDASPPDDATAEQMYRIAQEAIHNVVKHADASYLHVIFKRVNPSWILVIRDDGRGMSADANASRGMGLDGMKSRAAAIGADLEVRSIPGRGTAVRCVVPRRGRG